MKKISTLFKKNPDNLALVTTEVDPENAWALTEGIATRKFDGTAAAIIDGRLYKRYDAKRGKTPPAGSIPCQEPDPISGHWPHWVLCYETAKEDKYFFEGLQNAFSGRNTIDGTYELVGPRINGGKEKDFDRQVLVKHGSEILNIHPRVYDSIKTYLSLLDIEGIVFHHPDGRMCKIRKADFGMKRVIEP